jgi:ubiquitin-like protein Pup
MMEPCRGTEKHVGTLLDTCEIGRPFRSLVRRRIGRKSQRSGSGRGRAVMAEQGRGEQNQRESESASNDGISEPNETFPATGATDRGDGLKNELDDLLDEIDEVLETNAEEFVKSYIQKGGE